MREIHLNGYIDDEIWYGDEITPASLHDELYPKDAQPGEDVRIILNSYGGSCNAATQMYDELKGYNQPAYDTATHQYTIQWTWCLYEEAMLDAP